MANLTSESAAPGRHLGRYELVQRLGRGGMGEVWSSVLHGPRGFRKLVALKLLRGDLGEEDDGSLVREARLGALLQHPNVVGTYELGSAAGGWFIAMELVLGANADQLLRSGGPLPPTALIDLGVQACAGLAPLHPHVGAR